MPTISYTYSPHDDNGPTPGCLNSSCNTTSSTSAPLQYHANYVPSSVCVSLVKKYTICVLKAYRRDVTFNVPASRETSFRIGYGRATIPYWNPATTLPPFLPSVVGDPPQDAVGVPQGLIITQEMADRWLWNDLCQIARNLNGTFIYPLHQNQLDALVSLLYSVGGSVNSVITTAMNNVQRFEYQCHYTSPATSCFPGFVSGGTRNVSQYMYQWDPDVKIAGDEFLKYVYYNGRKMGGFTDRRWEEYNLFTGLPAPYSIPGMTTVSPVISPTPRWGYCNPTPAPATPWVNNFGRSSTGQAYWRGSFYP